MENFNNGLCGCGRPVRYASLKGDGGSCNKYHRCPSYDEILEINRKLQNEILLIKQKNEKLLIKLGEYCLESDEIIGVI